MIWRLLLAIVLLGVIVGGIVGFNLFRDKMIAGYFAGMTPPPVTVSTTPVEPVTWKPGLDAIGTARALQGVELAVETSGIVKEILFQANDEVKAGQHLAQIDDAIERADLASAQAELDLAETQLARQRELRERGVIAINDLDVAQATAISAASQVASLTAVMNQKSLEAPFGGTIGIPQVEVGQFVDPGTVYATLQDLDSMRVDFSMPEQDIRLIAIDMPVTVVDRGRQHRAPRPHLGDRAEDRSRTAASSPCAARSTTPPTASTPASSCGCGSSCPRSRTSSPCRRRW